MRRLTAPSPAVAAWRRLTPHLLPFADAATKELPLGRLLRLSLFQVSVGVALVLLNGTLNRVMIVELGVPAGLVAVMIALPLVAAPFRALIGHKSDTHRSVLGWRRVPYIWMGTMLQFAGLAIMPFALLVLSGDTLGPQVPYAGEVAAALAFLLVGIGMHMAQTAGLALADDLAPRHARPRVVPLLYVMLLVGMVAASVIVGATLSDYSPMRLIQVIQGAALASLILNGLALWKQEARDPARTAADAPRPAFRETWAAFAAVKGARRLLVATGLGAAAFSMQDILLEPYGGEILALGVGATTLLTALLAGGTLIGFALAARSLSQGQDPHRIAALGALAGVAAFSCVIFAAPVQSPLLFRAGTVLIGLGGGLFAVGTLTAAMALGEDRGNGLALGAWGAVQATAAGAALGLGGVIRDAVGQAALTGGLGWALASPATGYAAVYQIEIILLFAALVAIGPLVRHARVRTDQASRPFGLAEFPG
ncbi:PucC protein [Caenispirillum salinarum AK4]|uniref:PucC protein n=1 Tax=Caenispirillum salinarum AK4 TaxID=1238182 RepID=K9H707_9PROT|nr:BCD family MFS transporter [Caenispirillum salinarum]EKV32854.1 PucC protein [Caenispirillum salinarum AK4]